MIVATQNHSDHVLLNKRDKFKIIISHNVDVYFCLFSNSKLQVSYQVIYQKAKNN